MKPFFYESFEYQTARADLVPKWTSVTGGGASFITGAGGVGRAFSPGAAFGVDGTIERQFGSNKNEVEFSIYVYRNESSPPEPASNSRFEFRDGTDIQLAFVFNNDGSLYVGRGNAFASIGAYAASATSFQTFAHFAGRVVFHGSSGLVEVHKNGTQIINVSGVNTIGTANAYANRYRLLNSWKAETFWQHIVIGDPDVAGVPQVPGDHRVVLLRSAAAGSAAQFAVTGAASNYLAVDETTTDGDSTYVSSSTPGQKDLYGLADMGTSLFPRAAAPMILAKLGGAGTHSISPLWKSGATEQTGTAFASLSASDYGTCWGPSSLTDFNTSSEWTPTLINALEGGAIINGGNAQPVRVTLAGVEVVYALTGSIPGALGARFVSMNRYRP